MEQRHPLGEVPRAADKPRPVRETSNACEVPGLCNRPDRGILLIDDDAVLRCVLAGVLRTRGFAVWTAASGEEALKVYERFASQISLVLSDVNMPGMEGPEAVAALRAVNPALICCLMTGGQNLPVVGRGVVKVFSKPFSSPANVVAELAELLAGGVEGGRPCSN